MMIPVARLNHAVLYVRDLDRSLAFYQSAFDFETISRYGDQMALLRAKGSPNHHDLGLMAVGANAPRPPRGATGLYHLAWEVPAIEDLAIARTTLAGLDALVGESDHGATKSIYGRDPDGNEFEIMWLVPRDDWGRFDREAITERLDLDRELVRYGNATK